MNKVIIGFTGKANSGKNTAASFIKDNNTDKNTDIFAFADPLKQACKILFNFSEEQLHDPVKKEEIDLIWNKSPREIFQWLGTDVIRKYIKDDFFIINMKNRIVESESNVIIVTDIRFTNEAEFIKSIGGKIFKIERPDATTTKYNAHLTEQGIPEKYIDSIIINDVDLKKFKKNVFLAVN